MDLVFPLGSVGFALAHEVADFFQSPPCEGVRQMSVSEASRACLARHGPQIRTGPDEIIEIVCDEPGWRVVKAKASFGLQRDFDGYVEALRNRVGDRCDNDCYFALLSRDGQIFFQKMTGMFSLRKDVPRDGVQSGNLIPIEEQQYHWYGWKYPDARDESQDWLREIMKKRGFQ